MYLIVVTQYKKKATLFFTMLFIWICIFLAIVFFINNTIRYTATIDNSLSFDYSSSLKIKSIYSQNSNPILTVKASSTEIKPYIHFKSDQHNIEFNYPDYFKLDFQDFPGSSIKYHVELGNKSIPNCTGIIQIWDLPYSLDKFLTASKKSSSTDFINFTNKKVIVNDMHGYSWEYSVRTPAGKYHALEVFIQKDKCMYRISYFLPEKYFNVKEKKTFWNIVNSLKVN